MRKVSLGDCRSIAQIKRAFGILYPTGGRALFDKVK